MSRGKSVYFSVLGLVLILGSYFTFKLISPAASHESGEASKADIKSGAGGESRKPMGSQIKPGSGKALGSWFSRELSDDDRSSLAERQAIPKNTDLLFGFYNEGRDSEFRALIDKLRADHPRVPQYQAMAADFYFNRYDFDKSKEALEKLIQLEPLNSAVAKSRLSEIYAINENYDQALDIVEGLLKDDSTLIPAIQGLYKIHEMQGNPEQGRRRIEEMLKKDPNNGNLVAFYAAQFAEPEARKQMLQRAYKADPSNSRVLEGLAQAAIEHGDVKYAGRMAQEWMVNELNPEKVKVAEGIYIGSLIESKDFKGANDYVSRRIQEEPANSDLREIKKQIEILKKGG